ncbi:TRAP transporter large permease subunit [Agrobacterium tumefaciens]|uniref:TRAP transporter large permease subunit n=1 Tax=Agrobacterium TaxID=357 RepID=UPI0009BBF0BF|nr:MULTISPECIES: TRAP transporter large permease subunit [Agrobacterium]MDA5241350.1 TRAP transporter large permease subunit [Agrobacterium sp. MAFF310724]MDA5249272.1 TRAP transporter large permease subunit [Agrobacterium sp. MAFF210268]NTE81217.1 TRAP transporter large permease subunit [Agrobacterium tumefaciens]TRB13917.1 TRAP transporter large permease subunit [Agrobacterium tumefaciens]WCA59907.1 TRAP transporter large permease subunit [Agrobacterium tumefaciens]
MTIVMIIAFCILMMIAVPVGYALIISAGVAVLWNGYVPLSIVAQQVYDQTQSFPMLALPFFMLAGTLMLGGKLGTQLLELASKAMQRWRGGPLSTTVISSVVFGGVSGSAVANASALGSVLIPWQKRQGYPAPLCAANNATSAVIDVLIPPSIPMILYSLVSGVSIANLFIAGILPGLLMAAGFIFVCWAIAVRRGYAVRDESTRKRDLALLAFRSLPAILLPILIILGLRFGFATPTEVAVLSVVYSLVLSIFFYRDLTWKRFCDNFVEAGSATGVVMLVIMGSAAVGWVLTFDQAPQHFATWVAENISNPILIILMMNILMLIIGMPLDLPPSILLLGPIFVPLADMIGLDRVQLGMMMVINLGIGLYTPPIGTTLFISSSIARAPLGATTRELWPFFTMAMLLLIAVSFIPALTIY